MKNEIKTKIIDALKTKFSNEQARCFVSNKIAKALWGPIPDYSCRKSYHVLSVNTATVSVFAICLYKCEIVLIKHHNGKWACPGGFVNIDPDIMEQPNDAILREFKEELCNDKNAPVIKPSKQRFLSFNTYFDYRKFDMDLTPTLNIAYVLQLTETEYLKLCKHMKCFSNKDYRNKVQNNTNNEVYDVKIINITKIKSKDLSHPNEFKAIRELAQTL